MIGYTDPGTGTLIWQLLAAAGVGSMFYFRRIFTWIKSKFKRKEKEPIE